MSNTTFTTSTKSFSANDRHRAFTSNTLSHERGTVTVSAIENEDGNNHISQFVHDAADISFEPGFTDDGSKAVRIRINGEVTVNLSVFGVDLADVLVAAAEALRKAAAQS